MIPYRRSHAGEHRPQRLIQLANQVAGRCSEQQWAAVRRYRPKYLLPTPGPHWTADLLSAADLQSLADPPSAARLLPLPVARRLLAGLGAELLAEPLSGSARRACLAEPR